MKAIDRFQRWFIGKGLLLVLVGGCSSAQIIEPFPRRKVDEPILLTHGFYRWNGIVAASPTTAPSVFPWNWEHPLSQGFNLVWTPLPVEMRIGLSDHVNMRINLLGDVYYRTFDFDWSPLVQWSLDGLIHPNVQWVQTVLTQVEIRRTTNPVHASLSTGMWPLWQPTSWFYVGPWLELLVEVNAPRSRYIGALPDDGGVGPRLRVPFGARLGLAPTKAWRAEAMWFHFELGYGNAYRTDQFVFTLSHLY